MGWGGAWKRFKTRNGGGATSNQKSNSKLEERGQLQTRAKRGGAGGLQTRGGATQHQTRAKGGGSRNPNQGEVTQFFITATVHQSLLSLQREKKGEEPLGGIKQQGILLSLLYKSQQDLMRSRKRLFSFASDKNSTRVKVSCFSNRLRILQASLKF